MRELASMMQEQLTLFDKPRLSEVDIEFTLMMRAALAVCFIKLKELSFKYGQPIDASPLLDALTRNRELERVDQVRQQQLYEQQFQQQPPPGQMPA